MFFRLISKWHNLCFFRQLSLLEVRFQMYAATHEMEKLRAQRKQVERV